jgi:hypothetical protein
MRSGFESHMVKNGLLYVIQTGSAVHQASYPMDTGIKRPVHEVDHSHPNSAVVKKTWIYASTFKHVFKALLLLS